MWSRSSTSRSTVQGTTHFALLNTLLLASHVSAIWPFPPKRFSGNALLNAGAMGLTEEGRVVALGDFNGDQFLDVLFLGPDHQTLSVFLWSHDDFTYKKSASFKHNRRVYNVVPGDFTHDGKLDLLIMSQAQKGGELEMDLYVGSLSGGFDMNPISVPSSTLSQPIPFDGNGDMKIDLLGVTPESRSDTRSPLRIWQNVWNSSSPESAVFDIADPKFNGAQCIPADPHSNAVIDLNGDCLADLFLVCDEGRGEKSFQIWVNNKGAGYSLAQKGALPSGTQSITFGDIDRDGTIDMVFPTCKYVSSGVGTDCSINIAYNKQLPLCTSPSSPLGADVRRNCRRPEALCTADSNFQFNLSPSSDNDAFVSIPIKDLFPVPTGARQHSLLVFDTTHTPALPLPLKLGDANLDGFPDLLLLLQIGGTTDQVPKLLFNVPCTRGVVGCGGDGHGRRGWKEVSKKGGESLSSVRDARGVAFLDMDEDGTLDIMVQRTGKEGKGNILFVQNNFYYDAFFLKAIVLNGACDNGWCTTPNSSEKFHPFGIGLSGATYKYTVLDTSGRRSAAQVGQLPQTAYQSLLTPYSFFGLGRTNNYIENLFVGSTKHTKEHFINMEGVIPNSKVVILPPSSNDDGAIWKRELFLRPGEWIPWVTVTVIGATGLLAIIVFVLHLNEKREDELERRRASHHINFDAL